jgi:hypothetical protein
MDNFFSRQNVPMPIGVSINNIPMNLSTLNWGDKSRSFTWGRIICAKKEQNVEEKIYVFSYFERTHQSEWYKSWFLQLPAYNEAIRDARSRSESHGAKNIAVFFNFGSRLKSTQFLLCRHEKRDLSPKFNCIVNLNIILLHGTLCLFRRGL